MADACPDLDRAVARAAGRRLNLDGTLSWLGLFAAAVLFAVGQAVRNGTVREALTAVALWTLIASARAGAAWATTALS